MLGRVVPVLVFGLWLAACESEDQANTPAELFCEGLCDGMVKCHIIDGPRPCEDNCVVERPGLGLLSLEGARALGDCVSHPSCTVFTVETFWEATFEDCWDEAQARVRPTPHVRSFCADYAKSWFECGALLSIDECEHSFGMWADSVLDEVARCESQPNCEALSSCVEGIFQAL